MKKQSGFSLIELLIVLAIIGTLSTVAAFSWQRYSHNSNLRNAARSVAADMFICKENAVSEKIRYRMTFDVSSNSYVIEKGNETGTSFTTLHTKTPSSFGPGVILDTETNLPGGILIFLPRGTLGSATGKVVLKNNRNSKATVTINITGRTHVKFEMR